MFEQLGTTSRSHAVRDQLLGAINRGDLRPGDRLPSEGELVAQFGVSRASVRMALGMLETMGLIEVRHGRGSYVAHGPGQGYFGSFASWLQMHRDEVIDLMKVRGALDELAAAEAAAAGDAEGIQRAAEANRRFTEAARDQSTAVEQLVQLDIAFHNHVAEASGNALLPRLLSDLNDLLTDSRRAAFTVAERVARSASEHAEIVRALQAGDVDEARAATARHLESSRRSLTDPEFIAGLRDAGSPDSPGGPAAAVVSPSPEVPQ